MAKFITLTEWNARASFAEIDVYVLNVDSIRMVHGFQDYASGKLGSNITVQDCPHPAKVRETPAQVRKLIQAAEREAAADA